MHERFLEIEGASLWTIEQGSGPPMLLLNGGFGLCDYLGNVAALVDDVVKVYRFEPRGCGRSSPDGPYDLETMLSDIEELRIAWGVERWVVGGHSSGADMALAYTLTHPRRVTALVYLAGTGIQDDRQWHAAYERGREEGRELSLDWAYPFNHEANRQGNASWRKFIKQPSLLRDLALLDTASLFVYGANDIRPRWSVMQLAQLISKSEVELLEGAGHYLWLDQSDELRRVLKRFLSRVTEASST